MTIQTRVITIDGPSGTGKGTLTHRIANKLGWNILDSGVLYRALALAVERHHVAFDNETAILVLARHLDLQCKSTTAGGEIRIILEGDDVTHVIRTEGCGDNASKIGAIPAVREALVERQRAFCQPPGLVTDGRDMGTVIFPEADLKIYLDASSEARAERRYKQLKKKGLNVTLETVYRDIRERDHRDKQRTVAPLKPAKDAFIIDTTQLTIEQAEAQILQLIQKKLNL